MSNPPTIINGVLVTYEWHEFGTYIFPHCMAGMFTTWELSTVSEELRRRGYTITVARTSLVDINEQFNGPAMLSDN